MSLKFLPYSLAESYSIKDFSLCYKTMPQVLLPFPNSWDSLTSQMMIHILIYPILITTIFYIPGLLFISEQGMATIRPLKRYWVEDSGYLEQASRVARRRTGYFLATDQDTHGSKVSPARKKTEA